jgi:shikimate kinase
MRAAGPVVWLTADIEAITSRILGDSTSTERRPALTSLPPRQEIEELLARRTPLYAQAASLTINTTDRRVDDIVDEIVNTLPGSCLTKSREAGR